MAWFRNDLYHRVLTTSGTFVNQAWPFDPKYPDGAWGFHETLIPKEPKKPIRIFLSVGDRDSLNPNVMRDGMHDWVEANHRMAKVLKDKGYEYQYLFCLGQGHGIGGAQQQFLPHAIEWVWKGYAPKRTSSRPGHAGDAARQLAPARPHRLRVRTVSFPGESFTGRERRSPHRRRVRETADRVHRPRAYRLGSA
jgi:hypothetical protein